MELILVILFAANVISYVGLTVIIVKNKTTTPSKEVADVWEEFDKFTDLVMETTTVIDRNTANINTIAKNQNILYTEMETRIREIKQLKNELASVQVFLMDKVINGEGE